MDLRDDSGRQELGRRIQSAIAQAGYSSLPEFAEALGCSRALIYQYVGGQVLVQLDRLSAIAELTDRPLDWFVVQDPNGAAGQVQQLEDRVAELVGRCEALEGALADARQKRIDDVQAIRRLLLETLQELCRAQRQSGDMHALMRSAARSLDLARSLDDATAEMTAQLQAGHAAVGLGQHDDAEEALQAALDLAQRLGDERAEMSARQELVRVWQAAGRLNRAREQAMALAAADRWWSRWAGPVALAAIAERQGDLTTAEEHLADAERVISEEGAPEEHLPAARVYLQSNRANLPLARGRHAEAMEEADRLHELAAEAGLPDQAREAALNRAIAAMRGGDTARAEELLDRLQQWAELSGDRRLGGLTTVFEAERVLLEGQAASARRLANRAIEMGTEAGSGQIVAEAELVLGMAYLADDIIDDATYHLDRSRKRAGLLGLRRVEVAARIERARAMAAAGDEGARSALAEAREMAHDCGYEDLESKAALALDRLSDTFTDSQAPDVVEDDS